MNFTPARTGVRCEIHLLVNSRYHMFPQDYGYCGRKAKWRYGIYALCDSHKRALERTLTEERT